MFTVYTLLTVNEFTPISSQHAGHSPPQEIPANPLGESYFIYNLAQNDNY